MAVAEQTSTVSASEAFRVELLADGVQTVLSKTSSWISLPPGGRKEFGWLAYSLDAFLAAGARWRQVALEASLAVEHLLLLDEADVC